MERVLWVVGVGNVWVDVHDDVEDGVVDGADNEHGATLPPNRQQLGPPPQLISDNSLLLKLRQTCR